MTDLDKLLEQEVKREAYRQDYNARPEVKEKRKAYNEKRQASSKIVRQLIKGDITEAEAKKQLAAIEGTPAPVASAPPADDNNEDEE